eukprot:6214574-Pleurochrysis_carterae.AAC.1
MQQWGGAHQDILVGRITTQKLSQSRGHNFMGYDPVGVRKAMLSDMLCDLYDTHASFMLVSCAALPSCFAQMLISSVETEEQTLRRRPGPKTLLVFVFCGMPESVQGQARERASSKGT